MELQQYWLILKRRWFPAVLVFGSVAGLTVLTLLTQKTIYEAEGKFRFTKGDTTSSLTGLLEGEVGEFDPLVAEDNPINTELEVIRSVPIVQATIDQLNLKDAEGEVLERQQFLKQLRLTSVKGTDILQVGYSDPDPELAKAVVDTLMNIYLEKHLLDNQSETTVAREFIEQRLPGAEANVEEADVALREFKEANQIASLEEESAALVEASEDLRHSIAEAQSELASTAAQSQGFSQELGMTTRDAIAATSLSQSPGVQSVLTALQEVESQLAIEKVRFQDQHPAIAALETRKANLEALLDQRIRNTLGGQTVDSTQNLQIGELRAELVGDFIRTDVKQRGLSRQVDTLRSAQSAYRERLSQIPRLEQQQRELERKLEAAQLTYSALLQRLHEVRIVEHQTVGNAQIVQAASVLEEPIAPRKASYLTMGFLLGGVLAATTMLALEALDKTLRSVKEIRGVFRLPLLGLIPLHHKTRRAIVSTKDLPQFSSDLVIQNDFTSAIAAAYCLIETNVKFLSSKQTLKSVVVSSTVPQEGKSFVSSNLALAIAQSKRRVLLIDADLRCPSQHKIWRISNDVGLSQVLSEEQPLSAAIQSITDYLDILPAGPMPANPAGLLDSQQMNALLKQVSADYDLVLIDTPALNAVTDVLLLGQQTDGMLFVARPGVVDIANAGFAKECLEQSEQNILGLVINGVTLEHAPYSAYYPHPESVELIPVPSQRLAITEHSEHRNAA